MKKALSKKNLWERSPTWLRSTVGVGLRFVPPSWILGGAFRRGRRFLSEAQWSPVERAREYQLERLRTILTVAHERTKFYRRIFKSIGFCPGDIRAVEDLESLPTIDKQIVTDEIDDMISRSVGAGDVDYISTGGTSGTPLHFYINASRSAVEYAYLTTSWGRAGYEVGMPMGVLRGRIVKARRNGFRHEYDPILRHHYYSNFHMSDEAMSFYLRHIDTIGPCFLHVYPSSATALARFILRTGVSAPKNIKGILAESEIVYPEQRTMIEEVFGCRCFSCYGQTEKVVLATACEHSDDYHVWPTYGYFELLDDDGNPVTTRGERGEIVGTGFINTVVPFIRYRTGDRATYVGDRCEACGREHTIIRDIRGHRTQEVLVTAGGTEISWTALNMHDDTFVHVRQFQFLQEEPGQAVLRIVAADGFGGQDEARIRENLGCKFDNQLTFTIELTDSISLSTSGKAIYVDQRIQRKADL